MPLHLAANLRRAAAAWLVCALTFSAPQGNAIADTPDAQQRWSCALLIDYAGHLAARANLSYPEGVRFAQLYGSLGTTAFDEEAPVLNDFDVFFATLSGFVPGRGTYNSASDEWAAAFRQLPIGMVRDAWIRYRNGGPVACGDIPEDQWAAPTTITPIYRPSPLQLPPSHPDWMPAEEETRAVHVQIAPPTFDDYGYRALVINAAGMNAMIFEYRSDEWIIIARHWWAAY